MATFPTQDMNGTSYLVQLWSSNLGGLSVIVSVPADQPPTPAVDSVVTDFAEAFAVVIDGSVTEVSRYQTNRTQVTTSP